MDGVLAFENYGSSPRQHLITKGIKNDIKIVNKSERWGGILQVLRSAFLPHGYPDSVSEDYLQYQIYDTLQAFCSSITGTLATQAVLTGVGVGDENATVLAATITWLMKDGTGMCGRILFTWLQGVSLDCDCKIWRLFADILNDFATFLEILAPMFQQYFTFVVCVAGVCKSIVGVAGGATRAALTQHQARRNNMADVSAKDGSQETLVNLSGLLCSLALVPLVTNNQPLIWALFILFTLGHLYANYCAVRAVRIETFNQTRLHIVAKRYIAKQYDVVSVPEANRLEPVIWKQRRELRILLGSSFSVLSLKVEEFQHLKKIFTDSKYILYIDLKTKAVHVILHSSSDAQDQLQACFHCEVLEYVVSHAKKSNITSVGDASLMPLITQVQSGDVFGLLGSSYGYTMTHYGRFLQAISARGWALHSVQLGADEWRAAWRDTDLDDRKYK